MTGGKGCCDLRLAGLTAVVVRALPSQHKPVGLASNTCASVTSYKHIHTYIRMYTHTQRTCFLMCVLQACQEAAQDPAPAGISRSPRPAHALLAWHLGCGGGAAAGAHHLLRCAGKHPDRATRVRRHTVLQAAGSPGLHQHLVKGEGVQSHMNSRHGRQ